MEEKELSGINLTRYLTRFAKTLRWTWLPVLILALVFGCFRLYQASRSFLPVYESKAILSVSSDYSTGDIFSDTGFYDANAAEQIAETFPYLIGTDFMRDLVMAELGSSSIPASVSASSIAGTNMFELRATGSDPQQLQDVLRAVIAAYPKASVYMVDNSQIRVLDEPSLPSSPINAFSGRSALQQNFLKGLAIGLVLTFLLSLLNQSVDSEEELKKMISLPLLATLPQLRVKRRRINNEILLRASDDPGMAEAIRGLRAKVRRQLSEVDGKVVLLTSTIPGEGKTTAAVNLAMSLAAEGHATVLLDADLRNQTIGRLLGDSQMSTGLMALLKHSDLPVAQCLKTAEGSTLRYISGNSTNRRYYRIDPAAMKRVLEELKQQFDYIVIDTPPSSIVSDTALLCRHADSVLYVVRQDYANKVQIVDTVLGMHQRGLPLSGCILNGAPRRSSHYGYGYGYGKRYGYGKKYGYGRTSEE